MNPLLPPFGDPLPPEFYRSDPDRAARELLGKILLRRFADGGSAAGRIVETEAYSADDPASHSFPGPTRRNAAMFGPGGRAYVYLIYGIHHCFNVVTGPAGEGSAVLIRALLPLSGHEALRLRRGAGVPDRSLCDGPGKIGRAFALDLSWNGHPLDEPPLQLLEDGTAPPASRVRLTPRIGIRKNAAALRRFLWDYEKQKK